jgi:short-subunit dehydrogenase
VAEDIATGTGRSVEIGVHDLSSRADVDKLVARLERDTSVTLLANIAGAVTFSPFAQIAAADIDRMLAVNITALTRLTLAVTPGFAARGTGTIVNFASISAFYPWAELNVYNATKAFAVTLSQSLQSELSKLGVLVQVVAPPATATPTFWRQAGFPLENLPAQIVMNRDELVQAALVGLDKREEWVLPSLADVKVWEAFQKARANLVEGMANSSLAARYTNASRQSSGKGRAH